MIIPALVHTLMGPTSPFGFSTAVPTFTEATAIISPLDLVYELILLAIPAIFIVIVIYWIAGRRSSWAGYNEAVKWTRR